MNDLNKWDTQEFLINRSDRPDRPDLWQIEIVYFFAETLKTSQRPLQELKIAGESPTVIDPNKESLLKIPGSVGDIAYHKNQIWFFVEEEPDQCQAISPDGSITNSIHTIRFFCWLHQSET